MENYVSAQLITWGWSALLGLLCALVYDLLRTVRLRRGSAWLMHVLDAVYAAAVLLAVILLALQQGQGELRLYMLLGMALGALGYGLLLRRLLLPVWRFWVDTAAEFLRLIYFPVDFVWKTFKKAGCFAKKLFHFWKKCATMTLYLWKCVLLSEKGQEKGAKHEKKTAKEKPRRHRAAGGGAADRRGWL